MPTPPFKTKSGKIETAMGKAGPLAPAKDGGGKMAASEINDFGFDLLRQLDQSGQPVRFSHQHRPCVGDGAARRGGSDRDRDGQGPGVVQLRSPGGEIVALLAALKADNYTEEGYDDNGNPVSAQGARLDIANATFAQHGMTLEQAYLDALSSRFASGMYLVDYQKDPEAARQVLNDWVYDHTQGLIPQLLAPGDVDTNTP